MDNHFEVMWDVFKDKFFHRTEGVMVLMNIINNKEDPKLFFYAEQQYG